MYDIETNKPISLVISRVERPMVIYCITQGRKLYLRRIFSHLTLWHPDPALALRLDEEQAGCIAQKLEQMPRLTTDAVIGTE